MYVLCFFSWVHMRSTKLVYMNTSALLLLVISTTLADPEYDNSIYASGEGEDDSGLPSQLVDDINLSPNDISESAKYSNAELQDPSDVKSGGFGPKKTPWINRKDSNYLYQFNKGETSWIFAREYCRQQGADLAWLDSYEEAQWLLNRAAAVVRENGAANKFILLNLALDPESQLWKWSNNVTYDPTFIPWVQNNANPVENCAAYNVQGNGLVDVSCDFRQLALALTRFVCKMSIDDMHKYGLSYEIDNTYRLLQSYNQVRLCDRHWHYYKGSCYRLLKAIKRRWAEAELFCGSHFGLDCHLARLNSDVDQKNVYTLYTSKRGSMPYHGVWVGATDQQQEGVWKWWDNSAVGYNISWDQGYYGVIQPDDSSHQSNCLAYAPNGGMHDLWCSQRAAFICEKLPALYFYEEYGIDD